MKKTAMGGKAPDEELSDEDFDAIVDSLTMAQAALLTGYSYERLRQLARDGYFIKNADGTVKLANVIRGIERVIFGWKPPGYHSY